MMSGVAPAPTDQPSGNDAPSAGDGDAADDDARYTIDELASLTGVPSRTIRFYQSKGTLPSPERRGRVAYYRAEHVERLKVIAELQDRGLRLDAIRDALQQIEHGGDSLQSWLGMGDTLQAPWSDDHPVVLSEHELIERLGGNRPGLLADLSRIGSIERQGNSRPATYVVPSPGLLDIGVSLEKAGVDATTGWEASEIMRRRLARMADELVEFFAERAGQGFGGHGEPEAILRSFTALRPEGVRAVQLIFAQEMERSLRTFVEHGGAMPQPRKSRKADDRKADVRTDRKADERKGRHTRRTPDDA